MLITKKNSLYIAGEAGFVDLTYIAAAGLPTLYNFAKLFILVLGAILIECYCNY